MHENLPFCWGVGVAGYSLTGTLSPGIKWMLKMKQVLSHQQCWRNNAPIMIGTSPTLSSFLPPSSPPSNAKIILGYKTELN